MRQAPALCTTCASFVERIVWDGDQILYEQRTSGLDGITGGAPHYGTVGYVHALGIDRPVSLLDGRVLHYNWRGLAEASSWADGTPADCQLASGSCTTIAWPAGQGVYFRKLGTPPNTPTWIGSLPANGEGTSGQLYRRNRYYDPASGRFTQEDPIGLAGGLNLYGFAAGDPVNFSDPFGLCPPKWLCDLIGASAGESSLEYYAQVAADPSSSGLEKFGATAGGLFAALWTPDTYLQTATTLTGAAGASRVLAARAGTAAAVEGAGAQASRGALGAMERQLATAGRGSVEKTIRTLTRRIAQHETKIANARAAGGNVSSMETEIRAWRETIDAARKVLGNP